MKRCALFLLAVTLFLPYVATGESMNDSSAAVFHKPFWMTSFIEAKHNAELLVDASARDKAYEPTVISKDTSFEVVRSAVHLNDEFDCEAYIFAELKNIGDETAYLEYVELDILDENGKIIEEGIFAQLGPQSAEPGESIFVRGWSHFVVNENSFVNSISVEPGRSYYDEVKFERTEGARAYMDDGYLCAALTNTTDRPMFNCCVAAIALDSTGRIVDLFVDGLHEGIGVGPGSTIIFRNIDESRAAEMKDLSFEAYGYFVEE